MNRDQAIEAVFGIVHSRNVAVQIVDAIWSPQPGSGMTSKSQLRMQASLEGECPICYGTSPLSEAIPYPHGLIQTIRGMCTDEVPYPEIDRALVRLDEMMCSPQPVLVTDELRDAAEMLVGVWNGPHDGRMERDEAVEPWIGALEWLLVSGRDE